MRVRVTKVGEYQFLTCFKHGLWGSKSGRFKDWQKGDVLVFLVDKSVAGFARVAGPSFHSKDTVWDNGVFPHRIPLKFEHVAMRTNRPPVLGAIRESLIAAFGPKYGWGILNQQLLSDGQADELVTEIASRPNQIAELQANLDPLMLLAKSERDNKPRRRAAKLPVPAKKAVQLPEPETPSEETAHTRAQYLLAELGRVTGCSVWVATNDRNRTYKGKKLGDNCLKALPNLGLNPDVMERIARIDVLWLQQNAPLCAFEVESTTQVFSGLLRMSDLLALVPALNMRLYIVAARERQAKVMAELDRPTFRKIGLSDYCQFVSLEDLGSLLDKISGFGGHVQPSVLDKVALGLPDDSEEV